jgi:hypothetical protein
MSAPVEMMKVFSEASSKRATAVRNGDMVEAFRQTQTMNVIQDMAEAITK